MTRVAVGIDCDSHALPDLAGSREENDMKSIFTGGAAMILVLMATPAASAQVGGSLGATAGGSVGTGTAGNSASLTTGTNIQAPGTSAAVGTEVAAGQTTQEAGADLKRATRKSRRDIGATANGGPSVAAVQARAQSRTPDAGR